MKEQIKTLAQLLKNPEWLWSRVNRSGDCWNWKLKPNSSGYGTLRVNGGGSVLAHRAAYFLEHRYLFTAFSVCHKCDNPLCCNPAHLFLASHAENMADMKSKGRRKLINAGVRNGRAKLTQESAQRIRAARNSGALLKDLAADYCVGISTVARVCKGENWNG